MSLRAFTLIIAALVMTLPASFAQAQLPTTPAPAPATIWSFLGIPQGFRRVRDSMSNRLGKHPGLERKPPLKALADPANLESKVPAIQAAAEIKAAEDLAPQKIKAVKYLAEIGCGCYNKDGKITEALAAAMGDCTEDVRLAAVEAIAAGAEGECCSNCNEKSCCNEDITKMLSDLAYEMNDNGCPLEPSERVREAAIEALQVCCPNQGPYYEVEQEDIEIEGSEGPGAIEVPNPDVPSPFEDDQQQGDVEPAEDTPPVAVPDELQASANVPSTLDNATVQAALHQEVSSEDADPLSGEGSNDTRAVILVDTARQMAQIRFPAGQDIQPGLRLHVYRPDAEKYQKIGEMQVVEVVHGAAQVKPIGELNVREIITGGIVVIP